MLFHLILKIWLISTTSLFAIYIAASCFEKKRTRNKLLFVLTEVNSFIIFIVFIGGASVLSLFFSIPFIFKLPIFLLYFLFTVLLTMIFINYIKNFDIEYKKYIISKRTEDLKTCICGTHPQFFYDKSLAEENPKQSLSIIVCCPDCHRHTDITNKPNLAIKSWNSNLIEEDMIDIFTYFPIF